MVIITKTFSPIAVFSSVAFAFVGSYACILSYEQYRLSCKDSYLKFLTPRTYQIIMALSFGFVAIWTMHFVAMSGVEFKNSETGERIQIKYNIGVTFASLLCVVAGTYAGLVIASKDKAYILDENDVVEAYIDDMKSKSIGQIRKIESKSAVMFRTLFRGIDRVIMGGLCLAVGVILMHYLGMKAMSFEGHIDFDLGILIGSLFVAVTAGIAGMWILFRLLSLFPGMEVLRIVASIILAVAVNAFHYMGMVAGNFVYEPGINSAKGDARIDLASAVYIAMIVALFYVWGVLVLVIADLRSRYFHDELILRELDRRAKSYGEDFKDPFLSEFLGLRELQSESALLSVMMKAKISNKVSYMNNGSKASNKNPSGVSEVSELVNEENVRRKSTVQMTLEAQTHGAKAGVSDLLIANGNNVESPV